MYLGSAYCYTRLPWVLVERLLCAVLERACCLLYQGICVREGMRYRECKQRVCCTRREHLCLDAVEGYVREAGSELLPVVVCGKRVWQRTGSDRGVLLAQCIDHGVAQEPSTGRDHAPLRRAWGGRGEKVGRPSVAARALDMRQDFLCPMRHGHALSEQCDVRR